MIFPQFFGKFNSDVDVSANHDSFEFSDSLLLSFAGISLSEFNFLKISRLDFNIPVFAVLVLSSLLSLSRSFTFAVAFFVSTRSVVVLRFRLRSLALTPLISSCWSRRLGFAFFVPSSALKKFCACPSQNRVQMMFKFSPRCIDMVRSTLSEICSTLLRRFFC